MITMENLAVKAAEKLSLENKAFIDNAKSQAWKEKLMAPAVFAALKEFCQQSETFAKAVLSGKTFSECLIFIAKGTGNALSDLDAYKKAVEFYLSGATVSMQLTIELPGDAPSKNMSPLVLNLMDLFS